MARSHYDTPPCFVEEEVFQLPRSFLCFWYFWGVKILLLHCCSKFCLWVLFCSLNLRIIIMGVVLNLVFGTKTGRDWNPLCFCPNARLYAHHICHVVLWMDSNQVFVVFLLCLLFDHRIRLLWDDDGRPYGQWTTRNHCCNFLLFCLQPLRRVHDSITGRYLATNPWSRVVFFFFFFWGNYLASKILQILQPPKNSNFLVKFTIVNN